MCCWRVHTAAVVTLSPLQVGKYRMSVILYLYTTDSQTTANRTSEVHSILEHGPEFLLLQWNLITPAGCVKLCARGKQNVSYDISRFSSTPHSPSISADQQGEWPQITSALGCIFPEGKEEYDFHLLKIRIITGFKGIILLLLSSFIEAFQTKGKTNGRSVFNCFKCQDLFKY